MMSATKTSAEQFAWETQPAAARWVQRLIDLLAGRQPTIERLRGVLHHQTGTRLVDWIDHFWLGSEETSALCRELAEIGYVLDERNGNAVWRHPLGMFPAVLTGGRDDGIGLRVE